MNNVHRGLLAAGAAAALAGALFATAAWRALTVTPVVAEAVPGSAGAESLAGPTGTLDGQAVALVAEHDPFRAERMPAPLPYRMPGDFLEEAVEEELPPAPPPPPPFQILGIVAMEGGGLVVITVEGDPAPQVLSVGQSVQGFRLTSVRQRTAVLERGDQVVQLAVADPSRAPVVAEPSNRRRRGSDSPEEEARQRVEEQTERLRDLLQQRQQQMRGRAGGGDVPVEFPLIAPTSVNGRATRVLVRPTRPDTMTFSPHTEAGR